MNTTEYYEEWMKNNDKAEVSKDILGTVSNKADELILNGSSLELSEFVKELNDSSMHFENTLDESRFLYIVGNCYQALYKHREIEWYSDDLSKAVIAFRKSLNIANKLKYPNKEILYF